MTVTITRDRGITLEQIEESRLQRREGVVDDEREHTEWVEYCLIGCEGQAHKTEVPDSESHFCDRHVHRSAHRRLKTGLFAIGTQGKVGG